MDKSLGFTPLVPSQNKNIPAVDTKDWHMNVYIWDMDETLILLKSLLDGTYAEAFSGSKDVKKGTEIGKRWENLILQVCDEYFFYEKIENYNEPYLDALSKYDDGRDLSDYDFSNDSFSLPHDDSIKRKVAYRHRIIAQKYAQGLHNILDQEMIKVWKDLYALADRYTDGWLSSARGFLELISGRNKDSASYLISSKSTAESTDMKSLNLNILVTSGSLIPSLVKCLLFQFDDLLSHENVYSSWEVGKHQCFMRIKERFGGPSVRFCVIGDGMEECQAAQMMGWPYIRIDLQPSGTHRFPGLTMSMLEHCIEDAYGASTVENNEEYES